MAVASRRPKRIASVNGRLLSVAHFG